MIHSAEVTVLHRTFAVRNYPIRCAPEGKSQKMLRENETVAPIQEGQDTQRFALQLGIGRRTVGAHNTTLGTAGSFYAPRARGRCSLHGTGGRTPACEMVHPRRPPC